MPTPDLPADASPPRLEQTFDALRLNALSDGLFAIVLTLLVLDIKLPQVNAAASARDLLELLVPTLSGYLITFIIAGLYWIRHIRLVESLKGVTRELLWINLMLLLSVGLLPFSTKALTGDNALGYLFYSANMVLIGVTQAAFWGYAAAAGLLKEEQKDSKHIQTVLWLTLITPATFAFVLVLLPISPSVARLLPFALIPANILTREPRSPRLTLPKPRWATFWRWVSFAPVIAFILALLWLYG